MATLFGAKMQNVKKTGSALLGGMIAKASSQVGVLESPIVSNRGPQVDKYILEAGFDPTKGGFAWCAAFFVGVIRTLPKAWASLILCRKPLEYWLCGTNWRTAAVSSQSSVSQPAAAVDNLGMFSFLDTGQGTGHVGLVKSVQGVVLWTIKRNTTDKSGSRAGIGAFERNVRKISSINLGFADMTRNL